MSSNSFNMCFSFRSDYYRMYTHGGEVWYLLGGVLAGSDLDVVGSV